MDVEDREGMTIFFEKGPLHLHPNEDPINMLVKRLFWIFFSGKMEYLINNQNF